MEYGPLGSWWIINRPARQLEEMDIIMRASGHRPLGILMRNINTHEYHCTEISCMLRIVL